MHVYWKINKGLLHKSNTDLVLREQRMENPPVALFAKNISPAQVPQTGFPIVTNSRRAGNYWQIKNK